ncbi:MAG: GNAT family N-acetyltransferase [Candidatus Mcinerneyibacterium aminivorans]|uniref:GNAT family N-acetyltransferase n=1 Tax=Candidatus Mcinerneyibacterium aminivorans TaxID=2703815 RepID=A0A5D0MG54_9BACT|nr:MAG: GNAT family N-acetyltransferase [Candidatus Mcinerneyibacterium aminivorans]
MDYKIRWTNKEDAGRLGYIHSRSWQKAYKGIVPDEILSNFTPEKRAVKFHDYVENEYGDTAVFLLKGEIIGFITLEESRDDDLNDFWGEIWGIYFDPDYWNKGYGSILLNWGIEELKNRGYRHLLLWVLKQNDSAIKFYEKFGFASDGNEKIAIDGYNLKKIRLVKKNI